LKFVDISYYFNRTNKPEELLQAHQPNLGYFDFLPEDWQCTLVKFAEKDGYSRQPRFDYHYFRGGDSKLWVPVGANRFIAGLKPDVVMVHGLIFPQQVLALKAQLPRGCKIIVQHHGERPTKGIMLRLQKLADKCINGYLFATRKLAEPWIEHGVTKADKVFEVMEGSSVMQRMDKQEARRHLNVGDEMMFLWVGRLNNNKNPLTVLTAFEEYLRVQPEAKLYMVYGDYEKAHFKMVRHMVGLIDSLRNGTTLLGKLNRDELAYWLNAADYYISASFNEGSGYALIEAMSCGCVPVVSDIPSFRKIIGDVGYLFNPGNVQELTELLCNLPAKPDEQLVAEVLEQFENELSFRAIARQLQFTAENMRNKS
jgi:glycosyltransferase involved in cell wall biosynthesis